VAGHKRYFRLQDICLFFLILILSGAAIFPTSAHTPQHTVIRMVPNGFSPPRIEIRQGDAVVFRNEDTRNRWPASNIHPSHGIYPAFDPKKAITPAGEWRFVFERSGTWNFHDHLLPELSGSVTVIGDSHTEEKSVLSPPPEFSRQIPSAQTKKLALLRSSLVSLTRDFLSRFPLQREIFLKRLNTPALVKNENDLRYWLEILGPEALMTDLLSDTDGGRTVDCHQEAHTIGRISYELYGAVTFQKGSPECHSGYYHGAMEVLLGNAGTDDFSAAVKKICDDFPTGFGRFECLHGVGHGVLASENYDLPRSLEKCRTLSDNFSATSCYGGVFMENIVTAQGAGARRGHTTPWARRDDPLFPCNRIDQSYDVQYQCHQMQTSWILTIKNNNFEDVAGECLKARSDMVSICFKSYGRDAAGQTLRNAQKIAVLCDKVPRMSDYYEQCVVGALNVIVDFWGSGLRRQASDLCRALPEREEKTRRLCYETLAGRLMDVFSKTEERKIVCREFERKYQNLCGS
jgi:hypothetical protein